MEAWADDVKGDRDEEPDRDRVEEPHRDVVQAHRHEVRKAKARLELNLVATRQASTSVSAAEGMQEEVWAHCETGQGPW